MVPRNVIRRPWNPGFSYRMISPASAAVAASPKAAATTILITELFMASPGSFCEFEGAARVRPNLVCASVVRVPPYRSNSWANPSHVGARPTWFCAPDEGAGYGSDKTLWPLAFNRVVRSAAHAARMHGAAILGLCAL